MEQTLGTIQFINHLYKQTIVQQEIAGVPDIMQDISQKFMPIALLSVAMQQIIRQVELQVLEIMTPISIANPQQYIKMQLVIQNDLVIASHNDNQSIKDFYKNCEIIWVPDDTKLAEVELSIDLPKDPRLNWTLEENKQNALNAIEYIAEELRLKSLSNLPGKIASYEAKSIIAHRIIESQTPDPNDISLLQLEADNRKISVEELAKTIIQKSKDFSEISTAIDGKTQKTKSLINSSKTVEKIWTHLKSFESEIEKLITNKQ